MKIMIDVLWDLVLLIAKFAGWFWPWIYRLVSANPFFAIAGGSILYIGLFLMFREPQGEKEKKPKKPKKKIKPPKPPHIGKMPSFSDYSIE